MAEKPYNVPNGVPKFEVYSPDRFLDLSLKGALRKIIETTQNLTIEQTIEKLEKYTKPSKESGDMFEMVALYQRSIQHLTILKIRVDARFGPRTFEKLMKT